MEKRIKLTSQWHWFCVPAGVDFDEVSKLDVSSSINCIPLPHPQLLAHLWATFKTGKSSEGSWGLLMMKEYVSELLSPTQTVSLHHTLILDGEKTTRRWFEFSYHGPRCMLALVGNWWTPCFSKRGVKSNGSWWLIVSGWGHRNREPSGSSSYPGERAQRKPRGINTDDLSKTMKSWNTIALCHASE